MPKISVIIATKNEQENIKRLLLSLKNQTFKDFEVIIIDNHSTDKTCYIARKFTEKIFVIGPERSTQRNYGIKKAKGKYILFIDADMELEKDVLRQCFNKLNQDPNLSGIIIVEVSKGSGFLAQIKALEKRLITGEKFIEAARFLKKENLIKIGGYDERLIAGEDWDLSQRMLKFGEFQKISAKIHHIENSSIISDLKKKYYYAQNIQKYAKKQKYFFAEQAGFSRFLILFKKPKMILSNPIVFTALLFLKFAQFMVYKFARINKR